MGVEMGRDWHRVYLWTSESSWLWCEDGEKHIGSSLQLRQESSCCREEGREENTEGGFSVENAPSLTQAVQNHPLSQTHWLCSSREDDVGTHVHARTPTHTHTADWRGYASKIRVETSLFQYHIIFWYWCYWLIESILSWCHWSSLEDWKLFKKFKKESFKCQYKTTAQTCWFNPELKDNKTSCSASSYKN